MMSYIVGLLAFLLLGLNPIMKWLSPESGQQPIKRMPRPHLSESMIAWDNDTSSSYECPEHTYTTLIYSKQPLVFYIENFLPPEERAHLLKISEPIYAPSEVTHDGATSEQNKRVRDSEVAVLPRDDVVRCIEARARAFQGWKGELWVERLRAQRYRVGGHYGYHFDWTPQRGGWGRVSSMMVYVDDDEGKLEGGGTEFPRLKRRSDARWCRFVECPEGGEGGGGKKAETDGGEDEGIGVVFKAIPGNAIFWENFSSDGFARGYDETFHAGLPVKTGVKVGLNIWSWGRID